MDLTTLDAYVVVSPQPACLDGDQTSFDDVVSQLLDSQAELSINCNETWIGIRSVNCVQLDSVPISFETQLPLLRTPCVLHFVCEVPLALYNFERQRTCHPDIDILQLKRIAAEVSFVQGISDLLLVSHFTRLSAVDVLATNVVQDGSQLCGARIPRMDAQSLYSAREKARSTGWPHFCEPEIRDVWNWLKPRYDMMYGFDGTRLGRAIQAFSNILDKQRGLSEKLMWSMIGLESLYATSTADISKQVRERSSLILGEPLAFKKRVSSMYNYRSRFIHGDIDFEGLNTRDYSSVEKSQHESELIDATNTSFALLAATIQAIISRGWSGLKFSTNVSDLELEKTGK